MWERVILGLDVLSTSILRTSLQNTPIQQGSKEPLLQDLVAHVHTIDWYNLGLQLGLNDYTLQLIQADERKNQEQLRCMFRKWLKVCENPAWNDIVKALKAIGENNLGARLEQQFCYRESF